jgi:hypothetical protein
LAASANHLRRGAKRENEAQIERQVNLPMTTLCAVTRMSDFDLGAWFSAASSVCSTIRTGRWKPSVSVLLNQDRGEKPTFPNSLDKGFQAFCHDLISLLFRRIGIFWVVLFRLDAKVVERQIEQV